MEIELTNLTNKIAVPQVPNFIRVTGPAPSTIDVRYLKDKDIELIGKAWTQKLKETAKKRRMMP